MTTVLTETITKTTIKTESRSKFGTIVLCYPSGEWSSGFLAVHFNGTIDYLRRFEPVENDSYRPRRYFLESENGTRRTRNGYTT